MRIFKRLFGRKTQGKEFTKKWELNERDEHTIKRTAALGSSGAATGAVIGLAAGGLKAYSEIQKVPIETVTVNHQESVTQRELMGYIPDDDYVSGTWRPSDDGVPTEPVYRNNPEYYADGTPRTRPTSTTFRGRGEPQPIEWRKEPIKHHWMNETDPYDYRTIEDTETYISHYRSVQRSRQVYDGEEYYTDTDCATSYNSDGSSSYDCDTVTRSRSKYRTEYYTEQEPVYAERTLGYWQRYSENIETRVVGNVEKPNVEFDHGVDVGGYLLKGLLWGAAIGAVAGGVAAAMEEQYFPDVLPGYSPKPGKSDNPPAGGDTKPPVEPGKPAPEPPKPKPKPPKSKDCGGRRRHTHDNGQFRHTHAGSDRWHYHGCPDTGVFNEDIICFKPDQVPECYQDETPVKNCDSNNSVCYVNKG